jgi:hypothetical protein
MRFAAAGALLAALLATLASCASPATEPALPPEVHAAVPPASALAGAVRALETLDAVRPAGTLTQLRALQCDTFLDHATHEESVRVFLHVSVFADTAERAREGFDELRLALESEAHSTARVEPASAERVQRVMAGMDWDRPGREDLLSYSDVIRLEVRPGQEAAEPVHGGDVAPRAYDSLASYVRKAAAQRIGEVDVAVAQDAAWRDLGVHRFRVAPSDPFACFTRGDIGAFLTALEGGSPATRLTSLWIERSEHEPDVHADRGWTFEAELALCAPGQGGTSTATGRAPGAR